MVSAQIHRYGISGSTNASGDTQQKLDILCNELFVNTISHSYSVCLMASEECEDIICVPKEMHGKYVVVFDPLDGSSNIDCLASIGSIFGIYEKTDGPLDDAQCLRKGRELKAAGYVLYGSATMMVLAIDRTSVNGFTLDPSIGEFVLNEPRMTIKSKGKIYSVNEGYDRFFDQPLRDYVQSLKEPKDGKPVYSARYVGSMVADLHRTLKYGGIFIYPATSNAPRGKLRLLYEANPMAFIIETAGGKATNLTQDILDIVPTSLHATTPVFIGSKENVDEVMKIYQK